MFNRSHIALLLLSFISAQVVAHLDTTGYALPQKTQKAGGCPCQRQGAARR